MSLSPYILGGIVLMGVGMAILLSGLDLSARREGRAARVDPTRIALGGLVDLGGVVMLLYGLLRV